MFKVQDYRPGTSRADLQDDQKRQRSRASLGGKSPPHTQKPSTEVPSDGSYKGEDDLQEQLMSSALLAFNEVLFKTFDAALLPTAGALYT